jgi:hypothetical protein
MGTLLVFCFRNTGCYIRQQPVASLHRSAFNSPQSHMCLYWSVGGCLLTIYALMLRGLETVQKVLSFLSVFWFFYRRCFSFWFLYRCAYGAYRGLIRRSSPGCIRCPVGSTITVSHNNSVDVAL